MQNKQVDHGRYGFWGLCHLLVSLVYTKLAFSSARIVRLPIDVRGRKYIKFGRRFVTGRYCRIEALMIGNNPPVLKIGDNVQINDSVHIAAVNKVIVGDNVLIASKVFITDHNHGNYSDLSLMIDTPFSPPNARPIVSKPVIIEDNVWIGEFVSILPGVIVGKGSIIATMSVVNRDVPAYSIVGGSPARVLRIFNATSGRWEKP